MPKFIASGFRAVTADSATESAQIFATRAARRAYGRRAYCRTLRLDSWTQDGRQHNYQAFIGRDVPGQRGTTSGRDEWICVSRIARDPR
jgi:hypothetical protein